MLPLNKHFESLSEPDHLNDNDSVEYAVSVKSNCKPKSKAKPKCKILVLGSSRCRDIGQWLHSALGIEYNVTSILKPNAYLNNVTEVTGKLRKGFTKKDHVIIAGGPENSLDRNNNCQTEKDLRDTEQKLITP
jgi:hypothetical protein